MKILLIAGGWSSEREISLRGAKNLQDALNALGHEVTFFDLLTGFDNLQNEAAIHDFAFLNLHGKPGEDGLVQAMLDLAGCPYQGSGPAGSFLALNKAASKQIFRQAQLPTADWEFLPLPPKAAWQPRIPFPLFAKSNTGGSSLRLSRCPDRAALDKALAEIFAAGDEAIIEPEIKGLELTCGILGAEALPLVQIEPVAGDFFDHTSKYAAGAARETCPAPVAPEISTKIQKIALTAHMALGLSGYSRSDFILDHNGDVWLLEVNTLPGMTATSLLPQEARAVGLDFKALLQRLIDLGLEKRGHKRHA